MPIPSKFIAPLKEGELYHIYNKSNDDQLIFQTDYLCRQFLNKYDRFLNPFLNTYAYSLLPNHFHLLTRVKKSDEILNYFNLLDPKDLFQMELECIEKNIIGPGLIEFELKRFLTSYAMTFNNSHLRTGNLFHRPFKRLELTESQFAQAMIYIHANALKHGITNDFTTYRWSSWNKLCNSYHSSIQIKETLDLFGGKEKFIKTHLELSQFYYKSEISIEP